MTFNNEDFLDLDGPFLRGPFHTPNLIGKLGDGAAEYIQTMQREYKMFWMCGSDKLYYAYGELPSDPDDNDPMVRMPFRFDGERYTVGHVSVYDRYPYPVRDNASQQTYVYKGRRSAFSDAVRIAYHKTPYGAELPAHLYKKEEMQDIEQDHKGKPISYGRSIYVSSSDAAHMLLGEPVSKAMIARLHEKFPHASFLTHGAPYIVTDGYGKIHVYRTLTEMADTFGQFRLHTVQSNRAGLGIYIVGADKSVTAEIVSGWRFLELAIAISELGNERDASAYDLFVSENR